MFDLFKSTFFSSDERLLKKGIISGGRTPFTRGQFRKLGGHLSPKFVCYKRPCSQIYRMQDDILEQHWLIFECEKQAKRMN